MKAGRQPARQRPMFRRRLPATANLGKIGIMLLSLLAGVSVSHADPEVLGHATDFTSDEYFEPPNQQRVKMRLSGTSATPLPNGLLDITNLTIQTFNLSGATQAVVSAPECIYAMYDGVASSSGHLQLATADGKVVVTGEGFLWRQRDNSLTISNNIHTVIQMKALQSKLP